MGRYDFSRTYDLAEQLTENADELVVDKLRALQRRVF